LCIDSVRKNYELVVLYDNFQKYIRKMKNCKSNISCDCGVHQHSWNCAGKFSGVIRNRPRFLDAATDVSCGLDGRKVKSSLDPFSAPFSFGKRFDRP
jgi:hypothetical protein